MVVKLALRAGSCLSRPIAIGHGYITGYSVQRRRLCARIIMSASSSGAVAAFVCRRQVRCQVNVRELTCMQDPNTPNGSFPLHHRKSALSLSSGKTSEIQ